MQDLKVTYLQSHQYWQDKTANLNHFSDLLKNVGDTDLVLLPEMFNTSFSMDSSFAEEIQGNSVQWMIDQSKAGNFLLGATLMIKEDDAVFNRFVIVNGNGVLAEYSKMHLFSHAGETKEFTAGTENSIIEINGWKILMKVCYDLRFPLDSRNQFNNPYDLAIYLANWPAKRSYAWSTLLKARAIENQCFVIGVNRIGKDGNGHAYDGSSAIHDPWGNTIHESENRDEIYTTTLDYKELQKIRENFNTLKDEV
ncbi:MAG: amidohydrolase [Crocinitomicaceae bacterium]|nr:amidohydrolase [Crocinitomicaceae bacterium]